MIKIKTGLKILTVFLLTFFATTSFGTIYTFRLVEKPTFEYNTAGDPNIQTELTTPIRLANGELITPADYFFKNVFIEFHSSALPDYFLYPDSWMHVFHILSIHSQLKNYTVRFSPQIHVNEYTHIKINGKKTYFEYVNMCRGKNSFDLPYDASKKGILVTLDEGVSFSSRVNLQGERYYIATLQDCHALVGA